MNRQTVVFIINPISGKGNGLKLATQIPAILDAKLFDVSIEISENRGHAQLLAIEAVEANTDIIVAVGGDGTINEIASALVDSSTKLCIIPSGSGNGIARHLRIPQDPTKAMAVLKTGETSRVDVMYFGNKFCLGIAGIGFDALVSKKFDESPVRGLGSYVRIVLKEMFSYQPTAIQIQTEHQKISEQAMLVCFANGSQYGNNAIIAPGASMQDEKIMIGVVKKMRFLRWIGFVYALFTGKLKNSDFVQYYHAKKVEFQQPSEIAHVDGEPIEIGKRNSIHIKNKAISVLHPKGDI